MVKRRNVRRTAKQVCAAVVAIGASQAGAAQAACPTLDDLVKQVFTEHAKGATPDSKTAVRTWFCEGASDAFLSQQATLPTSTSDLPAWNALFSAVDANTVISSTPPTPAGAAAVAQFRQKNCPNPAKNQLVHTLGRVATEAQFEAFRVCDAEKTENENRNSNNWDLDLSCVATEVDGKVEFSVMGFDAQIWGVNKPLHNLSFTMENVKPVNYSQETIESGEDKIFSFEIDKPNRDASIALSGVLDTPGDATYYFCNLEVGEDSSRSIPYGIPPKAECAFEPNRPGPTACPRGKLEQACVDGTWVDTDKCVEDQPWSVWSEGGWEIAFPVQSAFAKEKEGRVTYWTMQNDVSIREGRSRVNMDVFIEERACADVADHIVDGQVFTGDFGQKINYDIVSTTKSSTAFFFYQRPNTSTCLSLQFVPATHWNIKLDDGSNVAATLRTIANSMTSR
jgi:hypothetical protein